MIRKFLSSGTVLHFVLVFYFPLSFFNRTEGCGILIQSSKDFSKSILQVPKLFKVNSVVCLNMEVMQKVPNFHTPLLPLGYYSGKISCLVKAPFWASSMLMK